MNYVLQVEIKVYPAGEPAGGLKFGNAVNVAVEDLEAARALAQTTLTVAINHLLSDLEAEAVTHSRR